jgi:hypothetical protein
LYREHGDKLSLGLDKIENNALNVVSQALEGERDVDRAIVFNKIYKHRAAYRFWRGDFSKFREHLRCASAYGGLGVALRLRYWMSYSPKLVRASRKVFKFVKRFF